MKIEAAQYCSSDLKRLHPNSVIYKKTKWGPNNCTPVTFIVSIKKSKNSEYLILCSTEEKVGT